MSSQLRTAAELSFHLCTRPEPDDAEGNLKLLNVFAALESEMLNMLQNGAMQRFVQSPLYLEYTNVISTAVRRTERDFAWTPLPTAICVLLPLGVAVYATIFPFTEP